MTQRPLTTGQVAELFGVTGEAVREWADAGKLPSFKTPGGQLRFRQSDIETFLAPEAGGDPEAAA